MSIKFLVLGGILGFGGGGSADFIFMGARIFLKNTKDAQSGVLTFFILLGEQGGGAHSSCHEYLARYHIIM